MASESRSYHSPRRAEQARATRAAVLDAALRLFRSRGWAATTRSDIAREAGVSAQTVSAAFGTKRAVLLALLDRAAQGADGTPPLALRAWLQELRESGSAVELLRRLARGSAQASARAGAVVEVVRRAAAADPEVAELWQSLQHQRRQGMDTVVHLLGGLGTPLREGLSRAEAADVLWLLTDDAAYAGLVEERGWSHERFAAWLAGTMCQAVLG